VTFSTGSDKFGGLKKLTPYKLSASALCFAGTQEQGRPVPANKSKPGRSTPARSNTHSCSFSVPPTRLTANCPGKAFSSASTSIGFFQSFQGCNTPVGSILPGMPDLLSQRILEQIPPPTHSPSPDQTGHLRRLFRDVEQINPGTLQQSKIPPSGMGTC
jgi:hypothetical protein